MKMICVLAAILTFAFTLTAADNGLPSIIPQPRLVTAGSGQFTLDRKTKIVAPDDASRRVADAFNDLLQRNYGFKLDRTRKQKKKNAIVLTNSGNANAEGYSLSVDAASIRISGTERGMFYALQTLMQMMPVERSVSVQVQAVKIEDEPRFGYRGMHLDVSRHFMPVSFVKKYIDLISQYKFNTFHWHLTDDQGWRIEIKKYPKLTEIGSKRPESVQGRNLSPYVGDGVPVEGFYTQDEIKDVVAYAKARYVTVIPEIELPGHASAALTAYPELGCKQDYQYKVQTTWGIFKEVFCPTETTFKFLEDVLDETISLFPDSPYIHIGGDEVLKDHWKESTFVQELKAKENLKDEHEVQSYFVRRMEKFINSKGKKIIGWDEILEGGVAPNATIMSWRGEKGGIEAAKAKHDVIMTPNTYVYFDYGQGDPAYEPLNIGSYVPLEKVYSWNPIPKELSPDEGKYIIGGQANIWTEYLKTPANIEYMAFPRVLALAEVLWSRNEDKNYDDFLQRLNAQLPRLDRQNVNYRIPEPGGLQNVVTANERVAVTLNPAAGTTVFYTTDGSTPDAKTSAKYTGPIELTLADGEVKTLKTIVLSTAGRTSVVYAATVVRGSMLEPAVLAEKKQGVNYELVVPNADPSIKSAATTGETKSIQLNQFAKTADLKQPFAVTFDGYLEIPSDGVYELQIESTWDATLIFDGQKIIDDAGTKDRKVRSAVLPLKAGLHKISMRYNHRGGDMNFRFRYGIKGQGLRQAYGGEFFH
ncbi:MAG: family 20 glycosylhydrolase [Acidobacteriota bacterium]